MQITPDRSPMTNGHLSHRETHKSGMWMMPAPVDVVHDGWARALGIPAFGLSIPHLTNLFGPLTVVDPMFWFGTFWFVGLAAVVWQGNRALLFAQRKHLDWFDRPIFKIIALVAACVFYTAPITVFLLWAWFQMANLPMQTETLVVVALTNVICVLFVTHAYETAFLIRGRTEDNERMANMRRAVTEAQLDALRQQVDPHFLFNSLNTLGALIETDAAAAARFNAALADVYRYLLTDIDLVTLGHEMAFVQSYCSLLQVRFGDALIVDISSALTDKCGVAFVDDDKDALLIPPTAIQCLVENAVKHTKFSREQPLVIKITHGVDGIAVENANRPKHRVARQPRSSTKVGLKNLDERCRLLLGRPIRRRQTAELFSVAVPARPRTELEEHAPARTFGGAPR